MGSGCSYCIDSLIYVFVPWKHKVSMIMTVNWLTIIIITMMSVMVSMADYIHRCRVAVSSTHSVLSQSRLSTIWSVSRMYVCVMRVSIHRQNYRIANEHFFVFNVGMNTHTAYTHIVSRSLLRFFMTENYFTISTKVSFPFESQQSAHNTLHSIKVNTMWRREREERGRKGKSCECLCRLHWAYR